MAKNPRGFKMPTVMKIMGRSSSITNAFVAAIIPVVPPSEIEVREALSVLNMSPESVSCIYCGARYTEWDHLRPLVVQRKPTGFISEIANLVPSCNSCNQSKGKREWREWINSSAPSSPRSRGIRDIPERMARLEAYESWRQPTRIDIRARVGDQRWEQHWQNCESVLAEMRRSQALADELRMQLAL